MARMNCGQTVFFDHFDLFSLNLKLSDIEKNPAVRTNPDAGVSAL